MTPSAGYSESSENNAVTGSIKSRGKTKFEGDANIDTDGGVEKGSATS